MGWHLDCSVGAGVVLGGGDEVACVDAEPFEYFLCTGLQFTTIVKKLIIKI